MSIVPVPYQYWTLDKIAYENSHVCLLWQVCDSVLNYIVRKYSPTVRQHFAGSGFYQGIVFVRNLRSSSITLVSAGSR
jgi:hypothetical protein